MRDPFARRPGRPKTKWYVTLTARVPQHIAAECQAYMQQHGVTLSHLLRAGLLQILRAEIPSIPIEETSTPVLSPALHVRFTGAETVTLPPAPDRQTFPIIPIKAIDHPCQDCGHTMGEHWTPLPHLCTHEACLCPRWREEFYIPLFSIPITLGDPEEVDTLPMHEPPGDPEEPATILPITLDKQTFSSIPIQYTDGVAASDIDTSRVILLPSYTGVELEAIRSFPFDAHGMKLSKLCPRGHDYRGTGQTLRTIKGRHCLLCEQERKRKSSSHSHSRKEESNGTESVLASNQ